MLRTTGTRYVVNPVRLRRSDLRLTVDRQKAGLLGIPSAEVERTLRLGIAGLDAGKIRADDGEEYRCMCRSRMTAARVRPTWITSM